jgi:hypothetical protein
MDEAKARACREQAVRCAQEARTAGTPALKQMLTELAEAWNFLADEIERASVKEPDRNND